MEDDLDTLLDDALADFDKPDHVSSKSEDIIKSKVHQQDFENSASVLQPPINVFEEFFDEDMSEKLQQEWNSAMKELNHEDLDLANHLKTMSQTLNGPCTSGDTDHAEANQSSSFDVKIKEALKSMAKCSAEDVPTDDIIKNMFDLNVDDTGAKITEKEFPAMGMMEDMMKIMLSKDMLYLPMKEMRKNYPEWLEKNKASISSTEKSNYEKQLHCIDIICNEFESETDSDSAATKLKRFNSVMNAVNEMQQYGQPPSSLLADKDSNVLPEETCTIS